MVLQMSQTAHFESIIVAEAHSQQAGLPGGKSDLAKVNALEAQHTPVEEIIIDDSEVSYVDYENKAINKNSTLTLKAEVFPENATYKDIVWESSNPEVISIENNQFVVNGIGTVLITAKGHDNISQDILIKVQYSKVLYHLMLSGVFGVFALIMLFKALADFKKK